jgi:hypothetical protein
MASKLPLSAKRESRKEIYIYIYDAKVQPPVKGAL